MIGDRLKALQRAESRKRRHDALETFEAFCCRQYLRLTHRVEESRVLETYDASRCASDYSDLELVESRK